jgi:hypothetical protein
MFALSADEYEERTKIAQEMEVYGFFSCPKQCRQSLGNDGLGKPHNQRTAARKCSAVVASKVCIIALDNGYWRG